MSVLSCDSDSLADDWQDLSKSDYAKVIFHNTRKYFDPESGDVRCHFKLTDSVNKNGSDYIGLYKVGYENLTQCLAYKLMSELDFDEDAKTFKCVFKSEDISELNGFFQFLYVTHDKEVFGASMPFAVHNVKNKDGSPNNSLTTEKVEDGFLMVRYNLEQKNQLLETMIEKERQEKAALQESYNELKQQNMRVNHEIFQKLHEDLSEQFAIRSKKYTVEMETNIDALRKKLDKSDKEKSELLQELERISEVKADISSELDTKKREYEAVSLELQFAKKEMLKARDCKAELDKQIISVLIHLNLMRGDLLSGESYYEAEMEAVKAKFDQLAIDLCVSNLERDELKQKLAKLSEQNKQLIEEGNRCQITCAGLVSERDKLLAENSKLAMEQQNAYQPQELKVSSSTYGLLTAENLNSKIEEDIKSTQVENQKLKDELKQLRFRYQMKSTKESLLASYDKGEISSDAVFLVEQLDDAKYMIQALEDSKQLVMIEMNDVSKKLAKVTEELCELKCENILLKVNLEKANSSKAPFAHASVMKDAAFQYPPLPNEAPLIDASDMADLALQHPPSKKVTYAHASVAADLAVQQPQSNEVPYAHASAMADLDGQQPRSNEAPFAPASVMKDAAFQYPPLPNEFNTDFIKNDIEFLNIIEKLKKRNDEKKSQIEELQAGLEGMHSSRRSLQLTINEMIARLKDAEQAYKKLYMEKEKLAKKLRKMMSKEKSTSSSDSTISSVYETETNNLPLNLDVLNKSTSTNNDSDTGEHVRAAVNPVKVEENNLQAEALDSVKEKCEVSGEQLSFKTEPANVCDSNSNAAAASATVSFVGISPAHTVKVEKEICTICREGIPKDELPNHYSIDHNMNMCPVCDQLFSKSLPPTFLSIHVNEHFDN